MKKLGPGFYFSGEEWATTAYGRIEDIGLYTLTSDRGWFRNGVAIKDDEVPSDLWPVKMVQR